MFYFPRTFDPMQAVCKMYMGGPHTKFGLRTRKIGRCAPHALLTLLRSTSITLLSKLMFPTFLRLMRVYSKVIIGLNLTHHPWHNRYLVSVQFSYDSLGQT